MLIMSVPGQWNDSDIFFLAFQLSIEFNKHAFFYNWGFGGGSEADLAVAQEIYN